MTEEAHEVGRKHLSSQPGQSLSDVRRVNHSSGAYLTRNGTDESSPALYHLCPILYSMACPGSQSVWHHVPPRAEGKSLVLGFCKVSGSLGALVGDVGVGGFQPKSRWKGLHELLDHPFPVHKAYDLLTEALYRAPSDDW